MQPLKGEAQIREALINHIKKVDQCVMELKSLFKSYLNGDEEKMEKQWKYIDKLESQADKLRRRIEVGLQTAFMPVHRADLYRLVLANDKVANQTEYVSDTVKLSKPKIPKKYSEKLLEVVDSTIKAVKALKKAFGLVFDNIPKAMEEADEVRKRETECDNISEQLLEQIFKEGKEKEKKKRGELVRTSMLSGLIKELAGVADRAEDASDEIVRMAGKIVL